MFAATSTTVYDLEHPPENLPDVILQTESETDDAAKDESAGRKMGKAEIVCYSKLYRIGSQKGHTKNQNSFTYRLNRKLFMMKELIFFIFNHSRFYI